MSKSENKKPQSKTERIFSATELATIKGLRADKNTEAYVAWAIGCTIEQLPPKEKA